MERICRSCEYYDDGTGEKRTGLSGDCRNTHSSTRLQTRPEWTCEGFCLHPPDLEKLQQQFATMIERASIENMDKVVKSVFGSVLKVVDLDGEDYTKRIGLAIAQAISKEILNEEGRK